MTMSAIKSLLIDVEEKNSTNIYRKLKIKQVGDLAFMKFSQPSLFAFIKNAERLIVQLRKNRGNRNISHNMNLTIDKNAIPF